MSPFRFIRKIEKRNIHNQKFYFDISVKTQHSNKNDLKLLNQENKGNRGV
jgi:hypothetical protein